MSANSRIAPSRCGTERSPGDNGGLSGCDGLLDGQYPLKEGRVRSGRSHRDFMAVQDGDCWGLESLHNLMHRPEITSVAENLAGEIVTPFIHKAIRLRAPEDAVTDEIPYISTAHQDYIFVQGSLERNYTWLGAAGRHIREHGSLGGYCAGPTGAVSIRSAHTRTAGIGVDDSSLVRRVADDGIRDG